MRATYRLLTRWWTAFALAASLALLGAAHAFERFDGLEPCNLCLKQREVYWGAVAIALVATLWHLISRGSRGTPRIAAFLLAVVFAWLLLGELPGPAQLVGGALVLAGVVLVKLGERSVATSAGPTVEPVPPGA